MPRWSVADRPNMGRPARATNGEHSDDRIAERLIESRLTGATAVVAYCVFQ